MPQIAVIKSSKILGALMRTSSATVGFDTTFDPVGVDQLTGVAKWADQSGGIPVGYPVQTMHLRLPKGNSGVYKVTHRVSVPRLATTSPSTNTGIEPAPSKAYEVAFHGEWLLSERSTEAERIILVSHVISSLLDTINASDDVPTDATGSPLRLMITKLQALF